MKPSISAAAVLLGLLLAGTASDARAAEKKTDKPHDIRLDARALPQALTALVMQTGISIGGLDPAQCNARPRAVSGTLTAHQALKKLLDGSSCDVQRIDALTYKLVARLRPASAPKPKPAPRPISVATSANDDITMVVVRHPSRQLSTPAGVSIVAPPLLSGNDTDLSLIAPHVSGMTVTNLGPGRDKIFLRGISDSVMTGRTQSTVGLYLDDTPITYNAPDPDLLLVDMARIEVLKGPQGNLYGQGALSGVVRLVTNKPRLAQFEGEIGVAAGMAKDSRPSWRETVMLNVPLPGDTAAVRAVLYDEKSAGFIKDEALTRNATNDTRRSGGRLALKWEIRPDLTLDAAATVQDLRSSNSQYVVGRRGPYRRALSLAEPHDNIFQNLALSLTKAQTSGTWRLSVNRLSHEIHTGYDAQPVGRYVAIANSGILYYEEDQTIRLTNIEASFVSPPDRPLRWLVGAFAARSDETFTPHLIDVYTNITLYDEVREDIVDDAAIFSKLTWDFAPKWSISAGLRAQRSRHRTDSRISNVRLVDYLPNGRITGDISASPVSHELMLSYQPHERLLIYGLSSDGFRTGGFNTTTLTTTVVPTIYSGDKLQSLEAGFKYKSPAGRVRLDMAVFHIDWHDIQSDQLRATGLPRTLNLGDGKNTGLEIEAGWRVLPDLNLQFRGQFNDPKLDSVNPLYPTITKGGMPYISKSSTSLSAQWSHSLFGHPLDHTATLYHRSSSPLNYGVTAPVTMRGYTNLDLASTLEFNRYSMALRVTNALANKSNSFAYGNPFALDTAAQTTPLRPRTLWLSVNRRF
ncbi:TonB-dependent receptor [Asticcacaulis sp. BYS171W]|uniref:TonB-dependent receptor n=1 Tax=Asticcacaulis aquaticus TaxID=2984212 RepID=A0ABT5HX13_9CAUL|nr:TonB-dependent receptor [Asticcacaulis aquaticus]MDC7684615.1 TonB-dependent receptor [Asticcacaulis aquaticus]